MAIDIVGNNSTEIYAFTVDKSSPELEIKSPIGNTTVSKKLSIDFKVNDDNLPENEATTILLPTNETITDQTYYEFDTSNLDDGEYNIQISAKDKSENIVTETISFTVDHSVIEKVPTGIAQTFDFNYYLIIGIVIAIVASLTALAIRKKKITQTMKQGL